MSSDYTPSYRIFFGGHTWERRDDALYAKDAHTVC